MVFLEIPNVPKGTVFAEKVTLINGPYAKLGEAIQGPLYYRYTSVFTIRTQTSYLWFGGLICMASIEEVRC